MEEKTQERQIGRNEPCPCGSGKKYKRCCGVDAAPKVTAPSQPALAPGAMPGGFDPNQMDPQLMAQFAQALQRLPRGQMQRLQAIMQRAMAGKDVTREAQEFEKTLPPEFHSMIQSFQSTMGASAGFSPAALGGESTAPAPAAAPAEGSSLSEEEARAIVAKAAAEGKISEEEASTLLSEEKTGSRFWPFKKK